MVHRSTSESMEQSMALNLVLNPVRQRSPSQSSIRAHLSQDTRQMCKTTTTCLQMQDKHTHTFQATLVRSFASIKAWWDVECASMTTARARCLFKWNAFDFKQMPACYRRQRRWIKPVKDIFEFSACKCTGASARNYITFWNVSLFIFGRAWKVWKTWRFA